MKPTRRQVVAGAALALVVGSSSFAGDALPPKLATLVLLKVLSFEPAIKAGQGEFTVLVVGSDDKVAALMLAVGELAGAKLQDRKLRFVPSALDKLEADAAAHKASAILLVGGVEQERLDGFHALAVRLKLYTLTTDYDFVQKYVAVGVRLRSGKPGIVINTKLAQALSLSFDPAVLKVAETYN